MDPLDQIFKRAEYGRGGLHFEEHGSFPPITDILLSQVKHRKVETWFKGKEAQGNESRTGARRIECWDVGKWFSSLQQLAGFKGLPLPRPLGL